MVGRVGLDYICKDRNRPANVPQFYANQALHARYALHARIFFLSGFVSVENKERCIYLPKLDVAGSIPVARSKLFSANREAPRSNVRSGLTLPTASTSFLSTSRFQAGLQCLVADLPRAASKTTRRLSQSD
jgi:hypothetical protein